MTETSRCRNVTVLSDPGPKSIARVEKVGMEPFPGGKWLHAAGPAEEELRAFILGQAKPGQTLVTLKGEWMAFTRCEDGSALFDATYAFADAGVPL